MQHRGKHGICCLMSGYVQDGDSCLLFALLELCNDIEPRRSGSLSDSCVQVVSFLEIDVDDVIAADNPIQWNGVAVHVNSSNRGNFTRQWNDMPENLLEVFQLLRQCLNLIYTRKWFHTAVRGHCSR